MTIKLDVDEVRAFAEKLGELKNEFLDLIIKGTIDECNELLEMACDAHKEECCDD